MTLRNIAVMCLWKVKQMVLKDMLRSKKDRNQYNCTKTRRLSAESEKYNRLVTDISQHFKDKYVKGKAVIKYLNISHRGARITRIYD